MKLSEMLPPRTDPSAPAVSVSRKRRLALSVASVIALIASTISIMRQPQGSFDAALEATARAQAMAREILTLFLAAETPEERAAFVIEGDRLLPIMQAYYAGREVDRLTADDFQPPSWQFNQAGTGLIALELPRPRGLSTVAACFKEVEPGRWLMDWDLWAQSLDARFRNFIASAAEGEYTLHVRLTSSDVCDTNVTLEVADPFNASESLTFAVTRPDLVALYTADLPKGRSRTATVQLVWVKESLSGTLQPVLGKHICWGFRGLDECPHPLPARPSASSSAPRPAVLP